VVRFARIEDELLETPTYQATPVRVNVRDYGTPRKRELLSQECESTAAPLHRFPRKRTARAG